MAGAVAGRAGLIVRKRKPVNLEASFQQVDSFTTLTERWSSKWPVPITAGRNVLVARVIDGEGNRQPFERDKRFGRYGVHHKLPIEVEVRRRLAMSFGMLCPS